jgi:serine/threonine protein phosphatase 1
MVNIKLLKESKTPNGNYNRIIGIGDVHGCFFNLTDMVENQIRFNHDEDLLIFLGDYIDRGILEYEIKVLNYLIDLKNSYPDNIILLKGNHEQLAEFAIDKNEYDDWYYNGAGAKVGMGVDNKTSLQTFCKRLPLYYETENHLFVHAGALKDINIEDQDQDILLWERHKNQNGYKDKTLVVGHTPREEVLISKERICLDTCAFKTGILSAYDILNEKVYTSIK